MEQTSSHNSNMAHQSLIWLWHNCFSITVLPSSRQDPEDRETPLTVYVGMSVFAKTRKRQLIDMLHENGLSLRNISPTGRGCCGPVHKRWSCLPTSIEEAGIHHFGCRQYRSQPNCDYS
ncbi:hypothetical protein FQA47_019199 [Oryzias melastigma]|uniref:Uncharacterized protein n=1 Tax=Oryzias melastigma TaxID=30732 RepID=A0A834C586_ORYME|nr:hypothetical protein FQA47_019199 [Oryzias melastigma]